MTLDQAASERQHAADIFDQVMSVSVPIYRPPEVVECLGCGRMFFDIEGWSEHYDNDVCA
jgi:hypothetical protein